MKTFKLLFLCALFLGASANMMACELPVITISSCLGGTTSWQTWDNNDYTQVKEVCAGAAFQFDVRCSKGTLLSASDEICIYEDDGNGDLILVYCSTYGDLNFVPEPGKTYKLTVNGSSWEINFKTVDCTPEIVASQNGQSNCFEEGMPIQFDLEGVNFDPNCFYLEWNFGDCTDVEYTDAQPGTYEHTFEFAMNPNSWCKTFNVTVTAVSFCDGCEDIEISTTITVCQMCYAQEYDGDLDADISVFPNPTIGPFDAEIYYEGGEILQYIIVNQQWDGTVIHLEELPVDIQYPYPFQYDLSPYMPGQYNVTVVTTSGAAASATVLKL